MKKKYSTPKMTSKHTELKYGNIAQGYKIRKLNIISAYEGVGSLDGKLKKVETPKTKIFKESVDIGEYADYYRVYFGGR